MPLEVISGLRFTAVLQGLVWDLLPRFLRVENPPKPSSKIPSWNPFLPLRLGSKRPVWLSPPNQERFNLRWSYTYTVNYYPKICPDKNSEWKSRCNYTYLHFSWQNIKGYFASFNYSALFLLNCTHYYIVACNRRGYCCSLFVWNSSPTLLLVMCLQVLWLKCSIQFYCMNAQFAHRELKHWYWVGLIMKYFIRVLNPL